MSTQVYGRYAVVDKIGQGGMSVVYRATDPSLDRAVALKVMHPHLAERAESRARFSREARAVARLRHPHIVEVYDYAPPDSEQAYIVSEFIDGPTLRAFAEEHPIRHPEVMALVVLPIVEALATAHDAGIIHRDVKPENIMVRPDGSPVLMDFGIAQMVDTETLTATGTVLGSPAHMAPEVIDGHEIGAPADIFAVGTVMYWLICGALPFTGPNPSALFRRILEGRFDPVLQRRPHAGRGMARLVEACLVTDTATRPTAAELVDALRGHLRDGGIADVEAERRALFDDPDVYQDELGRRLVPRLVTRARDALGNRRTAAALDLLDRALGLDENHPEAQELVERIERGQKRGHRLRLALVALLLLGVGGGAWAMFAGDDAGDDAPDAPDDRLTATTGADAEPGGDPAAVEPDARLVDAAPPDAVPEAAPPPDAEADAGPPDAAPVAARPIRRPDRRPVRPVPEPEPAVPPTPARVGIHGQHKGARVFVNGQHKGYLFEIERAKGLELLPGRYTLRFENPGCANQFETVIIKPGQTRAPPVQFKCAHMPATLRVEGPSALAVRRTEDGRRLGRTNQNIQVPMESLSERVGLTIGNTGDSFEQKEVTLTAGQRTIVRFAGAPEGQPPD